MSLEDLANKLCDYNFDYLTNLEVTDMGDEVAVDFHLSTNPREDEFTDEQFTEFKKYVESLDIDGDGYEIRFMQDVDDTPVFIGVYIKEETANVEEIADKLNDISEQIWDKYIDIREKNESVAKSLISKLDSIYEGDVVSFTDFKAKKDGKEISEEPAEKEEQKDGLKHIEIVDITFNWKEGDKTANGILEIGKTYPYEEAQKRINELDYYTWNSGSSMLYGGYDKSDYTANILVDGEPDTYEGHIDFGDGVSNIEAVNIKHNMQYFLGDEYVVDAPDIPYDIEEFKKKYGTREENVKKYIADNNTELPVGTDYTAKKIEEIGDGDIFFQSDYSDYSGKSYYKFYRVIKRTKSSVWLEPLKTKIIKQLDYIKGYLEDISYSVPSEEKDEVSRVFHADINKPFRLSLGYDNKVQCSQGSGYYKETLYAWDGEALKESVEQKSIYAQLNEKINELYHPFDSENKVEERNYKGVTYTVLPDGKYCDIRIYAPKGQTFSNGDTWYSTSATLEDADNKAQKIILSNFKLEESLKENVEHDLVCPDCGALEIHNDDEDPHYYHCRCCGNTFHEDEAVEYCDYYNEAYHPAYDNNRYYITFDGCEGQVFYAKSEEEAKELAQKDFFTKDFKITGVEYLGRLGEPKNESLNEDKSDELKKIFEDTFKGGKINCFETKQGVIYFEPQGEKLVFGGMTNAGIIPQYEFDYEFDKSFDWNLQGMIEQIMEEEGYPEDDLDESLNEEKEIDILKKIENEIRNKINELYADDKDLLEYFYVESGIEEGYYNDGSDKYFVEVRGELNYEEMCELGDKLDPIVQKYDEYAYFDMVTSGIMEAVFVFNRKESEYRVVIKDEDGTTSILKYDTYEEAKDICRDIAYSPKKDSIANLTIEKLDGEEYKVITTVIDKVKSIGESLNEAKEYPKMVTTLINKCWYGDGKFARNGKWSIALGGYNHGYQIYYDGDAICQIKPDNEVYFNRRERDIINICGYNCEQILKAIKEVEPDAFVETEPEEIELNDEEKFVLTDEDKKQLLDWGYLESDLDQIERAGNVTIYEINDKVANREEVIAKLGREDYLNGLSRSAFHWSAMRDAKDGSEVSFNSEKLFI